jgi:hypothetical protein
LHSNSQFAKIPSYEAGQSCFFFAEQSKYFQGILVSSQKKQLENTEKEFEAMNKKLKEPAEQE